MKKISSLLFAFLVLPSVFRLDTFQVEQYKKALINQQQSVSQSIVPQHNNLYRIEILVNNPGLQYQQPLLFSLSQNNQEVTHLNFSGANVGENFWLRFDFVPLPDSKNKKYDVKIVALEKTAAGYLEFPVSGQGDLVYKTYYKAPLDIFVADSLTDFRQRFFKDTGFVVFWTILIFSLVCLIVIRR